MYILVTLTIVLLLASGIFFAAGMPYQKYGEHTFPGTTLVLFILAIISGVSAYIYSTSETGQKELTEIQLQQEIDRQLRDRQSEQIKRLAEEIVSQKIKES